MSSQAEDNAAWVAGEVAGCRFHDARLGKRLGSLLHQLGGSIGGTIPFACQDWANTKAAYRFPRVPLTVRRFVRRELDCSTIAHHCTGSAMETKDWVGVYGALLSTSLAFREVWKYRRATRPKLVGYVRTSARPDGIVIEQRTPLGNDTGEARAITVQSRGGTATRIQAYQLFIPSRWVPQALLGILGEFGWVPSAYHGPEGFSMRMRDPEILVEAGADAELRAMLWIAHRKALEGGRLMIQVSHSWSRIRAQQIRVHESL